VWTWAEHPSTSFISVLGNRPAQHRPARSRSFTVGLTPSLNCSTWQDRLANPAQFGGQASEALDVVVLSLPGYVFSGAPDRPFFWRDVPATFASLMTDVLGYERFVAHGSDTL
jgi:hypothetical protein